MKGKTESVSKQQFYKSLAQLLRNRKIKNGYITRTKYNILLSKVKNAKRKTSRDPNILKKFDIVKEKNKERLIVPNPDNAKVIHFVAKDELFEVLDEAHAKTNHGGEFFMLNYLREKYKNVTSESVRVYLQLCTTCINKRTCIEVTRQAQSKLRPEIVATRSAARVDFISMENEPDFDYSFILVYRDNSTKFVQLKPVCNKEPNEVAAVLLEIFSTFGAPTLLQSSKSEPSIESAMEKLTDNFSNRTVSYESVDTDLANGDIRILIQTWLYRSNTTKWSEGLRFVQYMKNITYDEEIKKSPFEAMFGRKGKLDVKSLNLPQEMINDIRPEEEATDDIQINEMLEVVMEERGPELNDILTF